MSRKPPGSLFKLARKPGRPCLGCPRKPWVLLYATIVIGGIGGCAGKLAGSWETVQVRPAGASFPFNRIQFDAGKYTAMGLYDGNGRMTEEVQTTTGEFHQSGSLLRFKPHEGENQSYRVRRRLDGKLEIVMKRPGGKPLTAVLAPGS